MFKKSSWEKGHRSARVDGKSTDDGDPGEPDEDVELGCLTNHARFTLPATILFPVIALICSATPIFVGPIFAETPPPVTINDVFDPDLADVKPAATQAIKDAAGKAKASQDGCHPPTSATFTVHQKSSYDASFDASLGQARADALQQTLAALGYAQSQVKAGYAIGTSDDVQVNYDKPGKDTDAPRIKVTSNPPKGTKVKAGDKIHVTIIASERYADGHKSWPTGVQSIQFIANEELVDSKDYGKPPQPCARQTLDATYTVPNDPKPIIHLHAIAEDGVGNHGGEDADFPTRGDWYGSLDWSVHQMLPSGPQDWLGHADLILDDDGRGGLTGTLAGTETQTLGITECHGVTTWTVNASLTGTITTSAQKMTINAMDRQSTRPEMASCGRARTGGDIFMWPQFNEMLRKLAPSADGSIYQCQRETTVPGGTGHFALILRRAGR